MTRRETRLRGAETGHQLAKADTDFTRLLGLQRHEPLTREDRDDLDVIVAAAERGYRIAVQCRRCGQWLTNPKSVRGYIGPVCAAKAVD